MSLKFNNEKVKSAYDIAKANPPQKGHSYYEDIKTMGATEVAMNIMANYLISLIRVSEFPGVNLELDLTYATIGSLPAVIGYEFITGKNSGRSLAENIEIAEKTVASYLTLLALNLHNSAVVGAATGDINNRNTFSSVEVMVGTVFSKVNFLAAMRGQVRYEGTKLTVCLSNIRDAYKQATGVDLTEYSSHFEDGVIMEIGSKKK